MSTGTSEPSAVDDVVETRLEEAEQVVTGLAGETVGLFVVAAELRSSMP